MPLPNLILAGTQKAGTTWLHRCLGASAHVYAAKTKELNHFNKADFASRSESYFAHFPAQDGAQYYLESTPHYFQILAGKVNVAENIRTCLGDIKILLMFRDPVARYESAYIHHMMKKRFDFTPEISRFCNDIKMLELGHYADILRHWQGYFSQIGVFFYDDLLADANTLIARVMAFLELENDIPQRQINFIANARANKARHHFPQGAPLPEMTPELRAKLAAYYRPHINEFAVLTGRDLSHWCA
ncbi:MAG: sulfotransferase domain-containing protein [Paracoccaceae bacterium]